MPRRPLATAIAVLALVVTTTTATGCGGGGNAKHPATTTAPTTSATSPSSPSGLGGETAPRTTTVPATPKPGSARGLTIGIGDQGASMFSSPLFRALGIRHARLLVPYDAMSVGFERPLVAAWMAGAKAAGVEPFVTFGHSRVHPTRLPSVAAYTRAIDVFRARYPQVTTYAAWNEINHKSQPTANAPARAAAYYNALRARCSGCTIVAGDLLDQAGAERYLARYVPHLAGTPRLWGLHNYSDTNRFRSTGTRAFLRAVKGDVWLTETGGVASFGRAFGFDLERQARAITYMVSLARSSKRIARLYIYNWTGAPRNARFDAGLTNPDGSPRPAYAALKRALGR
jgi:hypothetical protein